MTEAERYRDGVWHKSDASPRADPLVQELIRLLRDHHPDVSWADFAEYSGIPLSTLMNWRSGKRQPTARLLRRAFSTIGYDLQVVHAREHGHGK